MVFLNQDKTAEAIPYLKRALSLVDEDKQKVHLLGDLGLTYATDASINRSAGNLARGSESFRSANNSFLEAVKLEPGYARTYRAWAWSLFEEGRYAEAWNKVKIGQKLKEGLIGVGFLYKLSRKMPEPN